MTKSRANFALLALSAVLALGAAAKPAAAQDMYEYALILVTLSPPPKALRAPGPADDLPTLSTSPNIAGAPKAAQPAPNGYVKLQVKGGQPLGGLPMSLPQLAAPQAVPKGTPAKGPSWAFTSPLQVIR